MNWIETKWNNLPPEGTVVMTKIDTWKGGKRNEQPLKRQGNLWFHPDGSMYVYYTPTHWMPIERGAGDDYPIIDLNQKT